MRKFYVGGAAPAVVAAIAVGTGTIAGCGKKKSGAPAATELAEGASIAIAGKLSLTGTSTALSLTGPSLVDVSTLSVYCVTFSNPPVAGTGSVAADGSFKLTLATAQVAVGCFILQGTEQLGTIVFKNPTKKTLSGAAKTEQRQAFAGDTDLGTVTLDLATGQAEVDVTQIKTKLKDTTASNTAAAAYDFTGTYAMADVDFTLPTGYVGLSGMKLGGAPSALWLKRINGTFAADGKPAYGLMIWESEAAFAACGSKLGVTYADAKTFGGVDLSASGVAEGAFTWASGWTDGWKSPDAKFKNSQMKMENATIGGYAGSKQYFWRYSDCTGQGSCSTKLPSGASSSTAVGYSFNAQNDESGCKKADGTPYMLQNWDGMSCTSEQVTGGLNKSTCTKDAGSGVGTVTCVHIGGNFNMDGTALTAPVGHWYQPQWDGGDYISFGTGPSCPSGQTVTWDPATGNQSCSGGGTLTPGALCSTVTGTSEPEKLAVLRCYSESYWQLADAASQAGSCVRRVEPNWAATTADEFVSTNGPVKAASEHIFEAFEYDSPTSGSFRSSEERYEGIQVGNNRDNCKVLNNTAFSLRKEATSNNLIVEMVEETRNVSTKPACTAYYAAQDGNVDIKKLMFKLVKQ